MLLVLNKLEITTLILHMSIMRKNVKKGFKSNYGKQQGKEVLEAYDKVKDLFIESVEGIDDENLEITINLSDENMNVLSSFLNWYVLEIQLEIEDHHINNEDKQQIIILTEIKDQINGVKLLV